MHSSLSWKTGRQHVQLEVAHKGLLKQGVLKPEGLVERIEDDDVEGKSGNGGSILRSEPYE